MYTVFMGKEMCLAAVAGTSLFRLLPEVAVGSLGVGGVDFVDHFVHVDVLAACAALSS